MPTLTRRRIPDAQQETWSIFYDGVRVGTIAQRIGNPLGTPSWQWFCGFYTDSLPDKCTRGITKNFDEARSAFAVAWHMFLANCTEAHFQEWRDREARDAEKRAMWAAGRPLPAQLPNNMMRCPCGVRFDSHDPAGSYIHRNHIYEHHAKIRRAEAVC